MYLNIPYKYTDNVMRDNGTCKKPDGLYRAAAVSSEGVGDVNKVHELTFLKTCKFQ